MKTIIWTGEDRMIPYYGVGEKGKEKTLPESMADNFIEQGLAELKTAKKKAVTKSEDI